MAENPVFDTNNILGEGIASLSRSKLVALAVDLCALSFKESGENGYRGGIRPDNISIDADSAIAIGPAESPDKENCSKAELEYIAPELFWSGKATSSADVYSIGLLLYKGITGHLPFVTDGSDDDCAKALRKRMSGDKIKVPSGVGKNLRRVIEQATEFSADTRYENTLQMASDLKSLLVKLNTEAVSKAAVEAFGKPEEKLSDVEKLMLGIITDSATIDDLADTPVEEEPAEPETEDNVEEDIEVEIEELPPEPDEPEDVESIEVEIEELPPEPDEPEDAESIEVEIEELPPEPESEPEPVPEDEDAVQIREATVEEIMAELKAADLEGDIEPIEVPEFVNAPPKSVPTRATAPVTANKKNDKKRPKVFIVIIALCAVLALAAFICNKITSKNGEGIFHVMPPVTLVTPEPTEAVKESAEPTKAPEPTETPEPTESPEPTEKVSTYQVFNEDISWDAAEQKCKDMGGHLVAINDEEEFNKVCELLNGTNAKYAWVGCYRSSSGNFTWTNGDSIDYYNWAPNEPSVTDSYDGTAEDYIMLARQSDGSWKYNDSRMNPVADYSYYYSGRVAYVCEITE